MWQRAFVLEHLAEIARIDPAAAGRASDEMLGLVSR
jgi:DNA-directed RNA polymerase subunit F